MVTCVDKKTYAEGGKKRLVTCVDKESFLFEKSYPTRNLPYPFPYPNVRMWNAKQRTNVIDLANAILRQVPSVAKKNGRMC